jgi:large subunit ribosomal protein L10
VVIMTTVLDRPSIVHKAEEVEALTKLLDQYNVIVVASLHKVRAMQLQELMKKFREDVKMKVSKYNTLFRALKASEKLGVEALRDVITGSNILLLTNMSPFRLPLLLNKNKVRMSAKAGDIAPEDIVVAAGNTGLPPGPAISELSEAGIRTRIESGSVYVLQDTVVARKGEAIQPRVASVLSKLGIKPLEVGLNVVAAYENGLIFKAEDLHIDLAGVKQEFELAFSAAFNLALNMAFPVSENVALILLRAHIGARNLALATGYVTPETIISLLSKAYLNMVNLSKILVGVNKEAAPTEFSS